MQQTVPVCSLDQLISFWGGSWGFSKAPLRSLENFSILWIQESLAVVWARLHLHVGDLRKNLLLWKWKSLRVVLGGYGRQTLHCTVLGKDILHIPVSSVSGHSSYPANLRTSDRQPSAYIARSSWSVWTCFTACCGLDCVMLHCRPWPWLRHCRLVMDWYMFSPCEITATGLLVDLLTLKIGHWKAESLVYCLTFFRDSAQVYVISPNHTLGVGSHMLSNIPPAWGWGWGH